MRNSIIINADYDALYKLLKNYGIKSPLLVADKYFDKLLFADKIRAIEEVCQCKLYTFGEFEPNPKYESVVRGVKFFNDNKCDSVIVVGGGSAIDVAKCIRLYAKANHNESYLTQTIEDNDVLLTVVPTTAGTGSEATRYAVIYKDGEKLSLTHDMLIPDVVVFDETALYTLPVYQRKCSLLDAFFHAVESFWSINSTEESREISKSVITKIMSVCDDFIAGNNTYCKDMLIAANKAGQAINITQTTAGHAMSYKLTSLFGLPHGHAVALCNGGLIGYMVKHIDLCVDARGKDFLHAIFEDLAHCMGGRTMYDLPRILNDFIDNIDLFVPTATEEQISVLAHNVNPIRLKNNPIKITEDAAKQIYEKILKHS